MPRYVGEKDLPEDIEFKEPDKKKELKLEEYYLKLDLTLRSIKDVIEEGVSQNKSSEAVLNEISKALNKSIGTGINDLKSGLEGISKSIKEIKIPEPNPPMKKLRVKNIKRDLKNNLDGFDIEVKR